MFLGLILELHLEDSAICTVAHLASGCEVFSLKLVILSKRALLPDA